MQRFGGVVRDTSGNALAGVTVTVFKSGTAVAATLYSDNSYAALANPFTANVDGTWRFYAAPGRYDVQYVKTGFSFGTAPTYDQLSYDYMSVITPAQIVANQNDYLPANGLNVEQWRLATDASRNITGIDATTAVSGQSLTIFNIGAFPLVLVESSGLSAAANQIVTGYGNITLQINESVMLKYDLTSLKWRLLTGPASLTSATALIETSGPTTMVVGAVAAGQFLERVGATLVGATLPFTSEFISADQTVTLNTVLTVAHGLSAKPKLVQVTLKNTTAELGYSIGDELPISSVFQAAQAPVSYEFDVTNVVIVQANSNFNVTDKGTKAPGVVTTADWRWVVRAWK